MNLNDNNSNNENPKKIRGLKFTHDALKILSSGAALIKTPITTGISIAAGLGSILTGVILENAENNEELVPAK